MNTIDQLGRTIQLDQTPTRIISTVPSITELLFDLELEKRIVGITKFCIHPDHGRKTKTIIGGTKNLNLQTIHNLKPDLIIANKEENTELDILELSQHYPVWISDIQSLEHANDLISKLGSILNCSKKAQEIIEQINEAKSIFQEIKNQHSFKKSVCYLIWKDPYMTVGSDTFINSMLHEAGLKNVFEDKQRYPSLTIHDILEKKPDWILLSSEPYPFKEVHMKEFTNFRTIMVDGEAFSWYGSHIVKSFQYFCNLIPQLS